jgi:hypothetical protein
VLTITVLAKAVRTPKNLRKLCHFFCFETETLWKHSNSKTLQEGVFGLFGGILVFEKRASIGFERGTELCGHHEKNLVAVPAARIEWRKHCRGVT